MIKRIISKDNAIIDGILLIEDSVFDCDISWNKDMLLGEIDNTFSYVLAYTNSDDIVCGYLCARLMIDELEIGSIAVAKNCQRQGIASSLLQYLEHLASSIGAVGISLEVCVDNHEAVALYTKHGFVSIGTRKNFYTTTQWGSKDAYIMHRVI